ncbi:hypothetical protein A3770_05p39930 [Chloropicon primus]|uniref:Uncharacterized protein n=2 Tax=Chloropicon primus TaxID=1764295 RepID=A0A5B8MPE9_9CHLO|nr:hypothetical protein A3770_05p39930 [Chloropicon primus]|eukprot:QDZ21475.1 hypothetical protein A3770_05p39930 [Chloropicon primus]
MLEPPEQKENVDPNQGASCRFHVYDRKTESPQFVLESREGRPRRPKVGTDNHLEIAAGPQGPSAVLAARYACSETSFSDRAKVGGGSTLNTRASGERLEAFWRDLRDQMKVVLAHPFRANLSSLDRRAEGGGGSPCGGRIKDKGTVAIIVASPCGGGQCGGAPMEIVLCPSATWAAWINALSAKKLYLAVDLDRTLIDSYTQESLLRLVRDKGLGERVKAYALSHYFALENYRLAGEIPWFMLEMYGKENVRLEENAICIDRERGSRLVFTKYSSGCAVLFWIRPGWDHFVERIQDRYFTCFITQSSRMHAELSLRVLKVQVPPEQEEGAMDGVKVLTVCRKDKRVVTKAFHLTGARAERCWLGLDDLCDGSDVSASNLDGVSIWQSSDLKSVLKPVPFHAYSDEAGKSDAISLQICTNILEGMHERFFASVERVLQASSTYDDLLTCPLPKLEDIMSYYHRNNTTSVQTISSFVENIVSKRFFMED